MALDQHVNTPTHRSGHTLDLIITRESECVVKTTPISDCYLSDHCTVLCKLTLRKPPLTVKEVRYRKTKAIDIDAFKDDLRSSRLCQNQPGTLTDLVSSYSSTLSGLLDKHAPLMTKTITVRPCVPWFNDEIKAAKQLRRKHERIWRRTGLVLDRVRFTNTRNRANYVMEQARREYYTNFIDENSSDQRKLFKAVSRLLGGTSEEQYPPHTDPVCLANDFGKFFVQKIDNIRTKLDRLDITPSGSSVDTEPAYSGTLLAKFQPVPAQNVKKIVLSSPSKSCENDPIPTNIVKDCIDELLPAISSMVNLSLDDAQFPDIWKEALVRPKLKKPNIDLIKKNYRPVSNLAFLSKVTEKVVAQQTSQHMSSYKLYPELQSAYRQFHSTETALLRVRNDILMNMNKQHVTLLVFLDLSAAFDTVDHDVLLRRLEHKFGICRDALAWYESYLTDRSQRIVINDSRSASCDLKFGVPQGSCLGPLLFSMYTSELFTIVKQHLPTAHCYADDTQLYLAFKPDDSASQDTAISAMEACLRDIRRWMIRDKLMINDDKTEFMMIGTKAQLKKARQASLTVGDSEIAPNDEAIRNLGVWFDSTFSMSSNITKTCKGAFYHLHNIRRIRKYLSRESTESLIHAFVTSRLDYCNGLLYGIPSNLISKLQRVQNAAARVLYRAPKFCHITPLLHALHWLPVKFRIDFKIIITTFKVIHGTAPNYLSDLISFKSHSSYSLRSNNKFLLSPPNFKTLRTLGDRAFIAAAPKLWNELPYDVRSTTDFTIFKQKLKTALFRQAYG